MDKKIAFTLILVAAIVGAGIMAYNADELYLTGRDNVVVAMPARLVGGHEASIITTATDLDGEPAADKEILVELKTNNRTFELYRGKTDSSGVVQPSFTVPEYQGDAELVVSMGRERLSQRVKVESSQEGDYTTKILITTDKPIYQPDQTVHIRTLTFEGVELEASERPVEVEITDSDGNKIFRKSYTPNSFGIANLDYRLSDQLPLGTYRISAKVGSKVVEKSILVEEYVLPKFKLDLLDTKSWYTVDEHITGKVSANYFFGKVVEGTTKVEAYVYKGIWDKVDVKSGTLSNGEFAFSLSPTLYAVGLDLNSGNGLMEINLTVTDTGGHSEYESHFITLAADPIMVTTLSDTNVEGTESTYYIITRYPNGAPVDAATVKVSIDGENFQETTDSRGIASVTFTYNGQTEMDIVASKGEESTIKSITIAPSMGIKVVSDKSLYDIGDIAKFDVFYRGDGATNSVYYEAISEGFVITTGRIKLQNGQASFEIPVTPDMSPSATIRVYKIEKDMDVVRDSLVLLVTSPEELSVNVTTDKEVYQPNEEVKLEFYISNSEGPTYSAIGVSGVDLSVFEVSGRFSGFEDVFWGLEEEFLTPQYQIISYVFDPHPTPLPADSEEEIEKGGDENEIGILSSWPKVQEEADDVQSGWVDGYWGALAVLLILGYFGLLALAIKYKAAGVIAVFLLIVVAFAVASVLYVSTSSMQMGSPNLQGDEKDGAVLDIDEGGVNDDAWFRFNEGDVVPLADFDAPEVQGGAIPKGATNGTAPEVHIRNYFPETWYWNPALITDENGYAFLTLTTPDSITSWGIDAIASTEDAQVGTGSAEVTVFQEFFVEPDIPVSVVRNDQFPLKVLVYNYDSAENNITITLSEDTWFDLLSPAVQNVVVEAQGVSSVEFFIRATKVGKHNITLDASSGTLADKIVKEMRVDPDGKMMDQVTNGQLDNDDSTEVVIVQNPNRVEGSENAYVKLQGGMEAVTLDGAESFIRFVSGCGEQSMSTLSIDILAFDTVQNMDGTHEKLFEFETIVNQGIQHELTFLIEPKEPENKIGRGIVWFPSDQNVHPWLTSWGLITFQDARNAGFDLDDAIITDMQDWLVSQQNEDGSYKFPDWGIYETNNPILKSKKVATTGYITRALLYSGFPENDPAISKALTYITNNINDHWDDPYTLSLALIALEDADGDSTTRGNIASRLEELKKEENGTVYWSTSNNMISDQDDFWGFRYSSSPRIIEATGYAIMALHKHGGYTQTVSKAVSYLLSHRSGLGGFFSTQDTVVAFQALASIGEINIEKMTVTVSTGSHPIKTIEFTDDNKDLTYLIDLRPYLRESTTVTLSSEGEGSVVFQVYYSEYIPWDVADPNEPSEMTLDVSYSATDIAVNDMITATLRLEYLGDSAKLKMVLVDLRAPVGFSFVKADFEVLISSGVISQYEVNDREVMVYIQDIYPDTPITFSYRLLAEKPVRGLVQGIHAFDMYNPDLDVEVDPVEMVSTL